MRGLPWRDPLPTLASVEAVVLVVSVGVLSAETGASAVVWRAAAWAVVSSLAMA